MLQRDDFRLVTVYEAANETLKQAHAGVTVRLLPVLEKAQARRRPAGMRGWSDAHAIVYRALTYSAPRAEAASWLRRWRGGLPPGWKIV